MTRSPGLSILVLGLTLASNLPVGLSVDAVPVFIWGYIANSNTEIPAANPFEKTSSAEFVEMVHERIGPQQPPIVVFVKDNLCVEDFTIHKKALQQATEEGHLSYFPAVEKAVSVFDEFGSYNVTFDEDKETIGEGELLMRTIANLDQVPEIYGTLRESAPNLMAVLTGRSCIFRSSERDKREVTAPSNTTYYFITSPRVILYSSEAPMLKVSEDEDFVPISKPTYTSNSGDGTKASPLILRMLLSGNDESTSKYALEFKFEVLSVGYYTLRTVNYKKNDIEDNFLATNRDISFPFNFSYHCSNDVVFQKGPVVLKIKDVQMQVDSDNFSDAYDCVGFTTIPIWTGIFVTAILALIMIWALTMIMDIRTMDRFDDPKGKTITIFAQE